jgi:hypothetical protein
MANTWELIGSAVVAGSGGVSSLDFTSIPATYNNLCVVASPRSNQAFTGENIYVRLNNTTTNYSWINYYSTGAGTVNAQNGTDTQSGTGNGAVSSAGIFGNFHLFITDYANNAKEKSTISTSIVENNATRGDVTLWASFRNNTNAVTDIYLYPSGGLWVQYSTAYLYGIKTS